MLGYMYDLGYAGYIYFVIKGRLQAAETPQKLANKRWRMTKTERLSQFSSQDRHLVHTNETWNRNLFLSTQKWKVCWWKLGLQNGKHLEVFRTFFNSPDTIKEKHWQINTGRHCLGTVQFICGEDWSVRLVSRQKRAKIRIDREFQQVKVHSPYS